MAVSYVLALSLLHLAVGAPASDKLLDDTLSTLERGLTFFSEDYSSINVDGLFGLRLGQGQLMQAADVCAKKKSCSKAYLQKLKSITERLDETCEKAQPYVEQSDPDYYKRFVDLIAKPYVLPYIPTKFDSAVLNSVRTGNNNSYVEEDGDRCYARIMGTFEDKESGLPLPRCNITHSCYNMMTSQGTARYAITHQLLYFMVIEHVGCTDQVEKFINGKKLFDIQKEFCQKIYKEADDLVVNGEVKYSNRDIFYEQTVLCGTLGFEDFYRQDWIKMSIQWPDKKDGCIKMTMADFFQVGEQLLLNKYLKNPSAQKVAESVGDKVESSLEEELKKLTGRNTMRKLLREKSMKDNCMAHASGLAFGTFGGYIHYMIRQI